MKNINSYRIGVGIILINKKKKIFVGKRIDVKKEAWQMPQGGVAKNEKLEDEFLKAIIMKYFTNAQVQVDKNVVEYLLKRVDRDYQKLYNILEKINILSLQRKSKITTHLIRDIMT